MDSIIKAETCLNKLKRKWYSDSKQFNEEQFF